MLSYRWIYLSYPLDENTPAYGGGRGFQRITEKSMTQGDSCNTANWSFPNHIGTHIDFPRHFSEHGRTLDDYPAEFFQFDNVGFVHLKDLSSGEIIDWDHLARADIAVDIELLLIKTDFYCKRGQAIYWQENPGFSPELADQLRGTFSQLRVIGFDSISLSSFAHRDLGRKAHRAFLEHRRPILPLEDMNLAQVSDHSAIRCIVVAPWQVAGTDGAPCTVMAEIQVGPPFA